MSHAEVRNTDQGLAIVVQLDEAAVRSLAIKAGDKLALDFQDNELVLRAPNPAQRAMLEAYARGADAYDDALRRLAQ